MILEHLDTELKNEILTSEKIYIATGLISADGADSLISDLENSENSEWEDVHIIVGIDMPTPVEALKKLKELADEYDADIQYYARKEFFFHPKVYLFYKNNSWTAFIGSANYTAAGLGKNIELTSKITNQKECASVLKWFKKISKDSKKMSDEMLGRYGEMRTRLPKMVNMDEFKKNEIDFTASELFERLKQIRQNGSLYENFCKERNEGVEDLRKIIDVENDFKNFNALDFCNKGALGHIIAFNVNGLKAAVKNGKMQKLCRMLKNDNRPVSERINDALVKYKVDKAGINVISKILAIINPEEYFLWNDVSISISKDLGTQLPRGLSFGEKYDAYRCAFKKLLEELEIQDFAVLDRMLYYLAKGF